MKNLQLEPIRVVQIIDSLEAGGGERMAVNLANAFSEKIDCSAIMVTRKEGLLKSEVSEKVAYAFVNKTRAIDPKALGLALKFVKIHKISHLHAHSTSFFFAILLKLLRPRLKLVWHDHYGESEHLDQRPISILKLASLFFNAIISVNEKLKKWALNELFCENVNYIKNFSRLIKKVSSSSSSSLNKENIEYHLIQVANIRPQKNHEIAIEALAKLNQQFSVKLHLLGQYNKDDAYYQSLLKLIKQFHLESNIEFYGSVENVQVYLSQADIAILSSRSEGLPLSLIEYAMAKKPIIVTDVGKCRAVVANFAKVVPKANAKALADAMVYYLMNQDHAQQDANQLYKKVTKEYGAEEITDEILTLYKRL